jgi:hypothetical protein
VSKPIEIERCENMSFMFDFDKYKKGDPRYFDDYDNDDFDYEYSDEFFYDDEYDNDDLL